MAISISTSRVSRRRFLAGSATVAAAAAARRGWAGAPNADAESQRYVLHFAQPAAIWPDALPVGNGRLGAMVFGNPAMDRLQLNEESI